MEKNQIKIMEKSKNINKKFGSLLNNKVNLLFILLMNIIINVIFVM